MIYYNVDSGEVSLQYESSNDISGYFYVKMTYYNTDIALVFLLYEFLHENYIGVKIIYYRVGKVFPQHEPASDVSVDFWT